MVRDKRCVGPSGFAASFISQKDKSSVQALQTDTVWQSFVHPVIRPEERFATVSQIDLRYAFLPTQLTRLFCVHRLGSALEATDFCGTRNMTRRWLRF